MVVIHNVEPQQGVFKNRKKQKQCVFDLRLSIYFRIKLTHIWKKWRKPLKDEIKKETFWIQKKNAKRDKVNATKAIRYYPVSVSLPAQPFLSRHTTLLLGVTGCDAYFCFSANYPHNHLLT